jgi:hypothetical protein
VDGQGLKASVFTVNEDTAARVPIEIAFFSEKEVAVKAGLDGVSKVVTAGAGWLTDGAKVQIAKP